MLILIMLHALSACNFSIGNNEVGGPGRVDIATPEGAREKLAQLNITYTVSEFVKCAKESDVVAVKLFLTAGMNPEARDTNGITALAAAKKAGHTDIIKLLEDTGRKH